MKHADAHEVILVRFIISFTFEGRYRLPVQGSSGAATVVSQNVLLVESHFAVEDGRFGEGFDEIAAGEVRELAFTVRLWQYHAFFVWRDVVFCVSSVF